MKFSALVLSTLVAFTVAGCGGSKEQRFIDNMEAMADAIDSAKGDCAKMAANLESFYNAKGEELKELKAWAASQKQDKAASEALAKQYAGRLEKIIPKMMGIASCADDSKVKAINEKLSGVFM
ncbi:MAG: hypothetical protein AB7O24_24845 [Kofleriaceae bacterium]